VVVRCVFYLFFVVNRVFIVIISPSDKGVAGESKRIPYITIGELEIISVIFHGITISIVIGVNKCRVQRMFLSKAEAIHDLSDVAITVPF